MQNACRSLNRQLTLIGPCRADAGGHRHGRCLSVTGGQQQQLPSLSGQDATSYCIGHVRKYDYESYLATLLVRDRQLRRAAFAVRAFNVELAQVRELTSSAQIARMRFQFWYDILDDVYGRRQAAAHFANHPVSAELYRATEALSQSSPLSKRHLKRLIDARSSEQQSSSIPFKTLADLEQYGEDSMASVLLFLVELAASVDRSLATSGDRIKLDHAATHLGTAHGLVNHLRAIPVNARLSRCFVPVELLSKHGVSQEDFIRGRSDLTKDICHAIASRAHQHLETASDVLIELNKRGLAKKSVCNLFLPKVIVRRYLERLQARDFDVYDAALGKRDGNLAMVLLFKSIMGRIGWS